MALMLPGTFCEHVLDPVVPLEKRFTVNQSKVGLIGTVYPQGNVFFKEGVASFYGMHRVNEYENDRNDML